MMENDIDNEFNEHLREDHQTLVYPEERLSGPNSPMVIYIPNKAVMFKIMRACIGKKSKEDLWVNFNPNI